MSEPFYHKEIPMKNLFVRLSVLSVLMSLACANVAFGQQNQAQAASNFSLVANRSFVCVGETTQYVITGTVDLVGKPIIWSSAFRPIGVQGEPLATAENNAYVNQALTIRDGMAFWTSPSNTWTVLDAGTLIKTATIAGISRSVQVEIGFCSPEALVPYSMYVSLDSTL